MPFPRIPLFYPGLRFPFGTLIVLIFFSSCVSLQLGSPAEEKTKIGIERFLKDQRQFSEIVQKLSLPDKTIRLYEKKGIKEIRVLYESILNEEAEHPDSPDLTLVLDAQYRLVKFAWGNYLLEESVPKVPSP